MFENVRIPYAYKVIKYTGDLAQIKVTASKIVFAQNEPTLAPENEVIKIINQHPTFFEEVIPGAKANDIAEKKGKPSGNGTKAN
jgi:hypothetical protein